MTSDEMRKREEDEHVRYVKEHLCDRSGDKEFVFISYKSDDWRVVLRDIVYTLLTKYGLNVYFDGSFDSHNSLWIEQFPENMKDYKCRGVLAFIDDKYATSYATLLELMYSQRYVVDENGLPVVPVNLDKLTRIDGAYGQENTGLGLKFYEDGTKNINAKSEEELFAKTFEELKERDLLGKAKYSYEKGSTLTRRICSNITGELLAKLGVNENYYESGKSLDGIAASIKDACGEGVFSVKPNDGQKEKTVETVKREAPKSYNFTLYGKEYRDFKLKYMMLTVFEEIMIRHEDKLDLLLASLSCLAQGDIINPNTKRTVFRAGKAIVVGQRTVSVGTSLNSSAVLGFIEKLLCICEEDPDTFILESGEKQKEDQTEPVTQREKKSVDGETTEFYRYQRANLSYNISTQSFTILAGSLIKAEETTHRSKVASLMEIYTEFLNKKKIVSSDTAPGYMEVLENMPAGNSPSAAAKMVSGGSINGNTALIEVDSKKSFGQLHGTGGSKVSGSKKNTINNTHKLGLEGIE
jgi:hypothetical protein